MRSIEKLRLAASQYDGLGVLCANLNAIADEIERDYLELPKDADGVPIRVGDGIEVIGGEDGRVVAIELCEHGDWNVSMVSRGWDTPTLFSAESVRHYHAPTIEDVLREFAGRVLNSGHQWGLDAQSTIAETADKLREILRDKR